MNWFDKKFNEYIENKLKEIDENEKYNKKNKNTIDEQEKSVRFFIVILLILFFIFIQALRNWNLVIM
nr:unnamed protein product [uncultured bacterium]